MQQSSSSDRITKQRLPFVDLLKGICIILIVGNHISEEIFPGQTNAMLQSFRVPLYYFLSGLFFKDYGSFGEILRRKTNNILVPFVFFFLLACILSIFCCEILHLDDKGIITDSWEWSYLLDPFTIREYHYGPVLWFLPSLFECCLIYYLLQRYATHIIVYSAIILLSLFGMACPRLGIYLPFMLDAAFIGLPFFALGVFFKQHGALNKSKYDKLGLILFIPMIVFLYFFSDKISILHQRYPDYFTLYGVSLVAITIMFLFAKNFGKVPIISYFGRYSIIILGTHTLILVPLRLVFYRLFGEQYWVYWAILAVIMTLELIIIPVMIRLFPHFTAQKELIRKRKSFNK